MKLNFPYLATGVCDAHVAPGAVSVCLDDSLVLHRAAVARVLRAVAPAHVAGVVGAGRRGGANVGGRGDRGPDLCVRHVGGEQTQRDGGGQ